MDFFPAVTLNTPINNTNSSTATNLLNCTPSDDVNLVNNSLILDGALNETNSSGINATLYTFEKVLSEGEHNWTCRPADNRSQFTEAGI